MKKREQRRVWQSLILLPSLLATAACVPFWRSSQPAHPNDPVPYHESWCYRTLGYAECYAKPQHVDPARLINVDPAARYPETPEEYRKTAGEGG